jgi:acyl dehydratase
MNVMVGQEIPELVKEPTTQTLAQYAGASGDFYQIHYDKDFAQSVGLPGVILHGLLKAAYLGQLLTDWVGDEGRIETFEVSYRGLDFPGRPLRCRALVKAVDGDRVELEIWAEDPDGNKTTVGKATVVKG